jgi:hypothetical protein
MGATDSGGNLLIPDQQVYGEYTDLLAQCHVELGDWQASMRSEDEPVSNVASHQCAKLTSIVGPNRVDPQLPNRHDPQSYLVQGLARLGAVQFRSHHPARNGTSRILV